MDLGLQGKVVVVTGGGAGIGAAISLSLAEEGAKWRYGAELPANVRERLSPNAPVIAQLKALQQ